MEAKKSDVSKAPAPIRIAFIALQFTILGLMLFATFADYYFPGPMPDWFDLVWPAMLATLFLSSGLLFRRDRELARCGFAIVIFIILLGLLAPA